jgi:hypothetical protein
MVDFALDPFHVEIPAAAFGDRHEGLRRTRQPEQIPDAGRDDGHFAALEQPTLVVDDLRSNFEMVR